MTCKYNCHICCKCCGQDDEELATTREQREEMRAVILELEAENAELNGYLDAIAAIPEIDAADGGCDEAVRDAIEKLKSQLKEAKAELKEERGHW